MKTTFSIQFYCRASKANRTGDSPIELSIIINGKRCFIQLPIRCKASQFPKLLSARRTNPVQEYCEETRAKLTQIQLDMLKNNIPFTANNLRQYYQNGGVTQSLYTISKLFDEYTTLIKPRIDKDLTKEHYYRYVKTKELMLDYLGKDILVEEITPAIIQGYLIYIQGKYESSTVYGIMTRTKTIIKYAMDNGRLSKNPFQGIKYQKEKKDIKYLTQEELNQINNLYIENESLASVRDCFILQASTGLSYIDLLNLTKDDIHITEDGTHYIIKNRHKTNVQYTTVVLDMGVEILKKHNYQLRVISNQKYNAYLKIIQKMTGIQTNITSHLARKTFATMLLNKGVRLEVVSKCLGHSSTAITQSTYSKMLKESIIKEVKAAF